VPFDRAVPAAARIHGGLVAAELAALGVRAVPTDVMMPDAAREIALARVVLELA
jgi:hypothetical protein